MNTGPTRIAVLSGGVGAARLLVALVDAIERGAVDGVTDTTEVAAIVNTGDDCRLHGLAISPDLDTVTYTLADAIDPARGWGLRDETWRAMESLDRYAGVRPSGSAAAARWFNLGDRDLATHFYRTARLAEGARLTEVTDEIRRAWDVAIAVLPMCDDPHPTMVTVDLDGRRETVTFQDYFVRLRHDVVVRAVAFEGVAPLTPEASEAIRGADVVVIAPSNPLVSIGPIRSLSGAEALVRSRRDRTVAISPIVGGTALKGPADRMLRELGHEASVVGVARMYRDLASVLVIDPLDAALAHDVEATGMRCVVTPSVMRDPDVARHLAATAIAAIGTPER
jgi:LPPG:FO 2-phospho-L-lactate transferase